MARIRFSTLAGRLFLVVSLGVAAALRCCSTSAVVASTDTISAGRPLAGDGRLVSNNSKFVLGFFRGGDTGGGGEASSSSSGWYLGIWFNTVPNQTTVWVANGGNPVIIMDDPGAPAAPEPELAISGDGDLAVLSRATGSVTWSTKSANATAKSSSNTSAVLLNSGNLVLLDASNNNLSETRTLWQSFDHPTDTLLPGAKLGRDKLTGLNRRLVSRKSAAGPPAPGPYCYEVDPAVPQLVLKLCGGGSSSSSPTTYWSSGAWNGRYFSAIPELSGSIPGFQLAFVDDAREEYLQFNVTDEAVVTRNIIAATGQNMHQVWLAPSQSWLTLYTTPKQQCDVYGTCGPFAVCSYDDLLPLCSCMKGFSVRSMEDWEQGDRTGGCVRDTPLDCTSSSSSTSGDKFYAMDGVVLPEKAQRMGAAGSAAECAELCLRNCTCTAYSYGNGGGQGCLVWLVELLDAKVKSAQSNGEVLYLRLAASEIPSSSTRRRRRVIIGVVVVAAAAAAAAAAVMFVVVAVMAWRRRSRGQNRVEGGGGLVAFRYRELRSATKNFSEKLGEGGFGSVFKGQLRDGTDIAVKRLSIAGGGGAGSQGEKQFRAEVSSIGIIQHVNLVRLIGFCCDGDGRFLVYEHMPNRSLDIHLFQSGGSGNGDGGVFLDWSARYEIAVGVARGLCYLHEGCRNRIIHCDIKPQNILLDASLGRPKIADFGMAKLVGRDLSTVLTTMRGTMGYLAPEWISGTPITPKVDVYSYGMVLLELVSGRRNSSPGATGANDDSSSYGYFPMEASRKLLEGDVRSLLDERLSAGDDDHEAADLKEVERACKVACWCIQDDEADRPAMGQVVQILEGVLEHDMPPLPRLLQAIFARPPPHSESSSMFYSWG